ncbi:MAG: hypothetical protein ACRDRP_01605 [Pseudonocardiaceae bacterium]
MTLLIGAAAFIITNMTDQPLTWQLTMTLLIGGSTLLAQFMIDFGDHLDKVEEKQEDHAIEMRSLIEDSFARTSKATELFQAVEASALQTDAVIQLVRHSTQISPASPPLLYEFAQLQIDRMSEFLKELSGGGVVEHDGEDLDWILGLTLLAKQSIDATSLSAVDAGRNGFDGGFWTTDLGRRYLKLQVEAVSRGVAIRRVFIIDRPEQTSEAEFLHIYQQHKILGIQARVLDQSKAPNSSLFDFVVFDGVLSYEDTPALPTEDRIRPTIIKTHLMLHSKRVKERMQRFEDIWALAHELG